MLPALGLILSLTCKTVGLKSIAVMETGTHHRNPCQWGSHALVPTRCLQFAIQKSLASLRPIGALTGQKR